MRIRTFTHTSSFHIMTFRNLSGNGRQKDGGCSGKEVGEIIELGGLLGRAPIMSVNTFGSANLVNRTGRIPAPIHSFKN